LDAKRRNTSDSTRFIWRLRWGRPGWCDHWPKYGLKGAVEVLLPVHTSTFSGYDQEGRDGEAFGENHAPWHAGEGSVREYAVAYGRDEAGDEV
jgi:hypothetical protein